MSAPAIISAMLVWLLVDEVKRGRGDAHPSLPDEKCNDRTVEMRALEINDQMIIDEHQSRRASDESANENHRQPFNNEYGAYTELNKQLSESLYDSTSSDYGCRILYRQYLKPHTATLRALFSCQSALLLMFQGAPGCIPWGIINTYLNDFLSSDRGMSVEVSASFILCFSISCCN